MSITPQTFEFYITYNFIIRNNIQIIADGSIWEPRWECSININFKFIENHPLYNVFKFNICPKIQVVDIVWRKQ